MLCKCSFSNAWIVGRERSSISIFTAQITRSSRRSTTSTTSRLKLALKCFCIHGSARLPVHAVGNHVDPISAAARYLVPGFREHAAGLVGPAALIYREDSKRLALPLLLSRRDHLHLFSAALGRCGTCEEKERWNCQHDCTQSYSPLSRGTHSVHSRSSLP